MTGEERRRHVRIFLPGGQVRFGDGVLLVLVGKVIDISVGGIKFTSSATLRVNETIEMDVLFPTGMRLKCHARIVHTESIEHREDEAIYGAQFLDLGEREKGELGEFVMQWILRRKEQPLD